MKNLIKLIDAVTGLLIALAALAIAYGLLRSGIRSLVLTGRLGLESVQKRIGTLVKSKHWTNNLDSFREKSRSSGHLIVQRYVTSPFDDPLTGEFKWGPCLGPGGGVVGVPSLSERGALETSGFKYQDVALMGKDRYATWRFVYYPARRVSYHRRSSTNDLRPDSPQSRERSGSQLKSMRLP